MDRLPSYTPPPPTRSRGMVLGTILLLIISLGLCPFIAIGSVGAISLAPSARLGTLGVLLILGALTVVRARWAAAAARPASGWMQLIHLLFWLLLALMGLWVAFLIDHMERRSMGF